MGQACTLDFFFEPMPEFTFKSLPLDIDAKGEDRYYDNVDGMPVFNIHRFLFRIGCTHYVQSTRGDVLIIYVHRINQNSRDECFYYVDFCSWQNFMTCLFCDAIPIPAHFHHNKVRLQSRDSEVNQLKRLYSQGYKPNWFKDAFRWKEVLWAWPDERNDVFYQDKGYIPESSQDGLQHRENAVGFKFQLTRTRRWIDTTVETLLLLRKHQQQLWQHCEPQKPSNIASQWDRKQRYRKQRHCQEKKEFKQSGKKMKKKTEKRRNEKLRTQQRKTARKNKYIRQTTF